MRRALVIALFLALAACRGGNVDTTLSRTVVSGNAHAGPVCPVESVPPDPNCADRPVPDAVIEIRDAAGNTAATARTDADGNFTINLAAGTYTFVPQPVEGLLGTAGEAVVVVGSTPVTGLYFAYDTGIR